jgi:hypothetical protein
MMSGVPVDMEAVIDAAGEDVIPLVKMWHDAKANYEKREAVP